MTIKEYIQKYVLLKIVSKEWKEGEILPSENKIAEKFNCSRITARQALGAFVRAGILKPQKGRGYTIINSGMETLFESNTTKFHATNTDIVWIDDITRKDHFDDLTNNFINNQDFIENFNLEDTSTFFKKYYDDKGLVAGQVTYLCNDILSIISKENVTKAFTKSLIEYALIPTSKKIEYFVYHDKIMESLSKELGWNFNPVISIKQLFIGKKLLETSIRVVRRDVLHIRARKEIIL
ncbi:GntR family transcriptional regulator [Mycoplasma marinum]|uniref:HTH gntR-type domain-containing protein n=1 Tax=Mycoplasma marinum TaxID=1937190 RepID=A0A4R0XUX7_9MOLU|nr:GntR family transcriptional regulator [Mycoplasma marinum]TCG10701.1 hypothetical protein C4B24_04105 [Mycoplasma marinum]